SEYQLEDQNETEDREQLEQGGDRRPPEAGRDQVGGKTGQRRDREERDGDRDDRGEHRPAQPCASRAVCLPIAKLDHAAARGALRGTSKKLASARPKGDVGGDE